MRHEGWVLIGRIGDNYYFCDSVFQHHDDFHGATGSVVRPVSPEEYEWASDRENVAGYLSDRYGGNTDSQVFEDWVDEVMEEDNVKGIIFDDSDNEEASASFAELGIKHECTDCIGCGRIFGGVTFDHVYNCVACTAIQMLEGGAVSADYAAKVMFE